MLIRKARVEDSEAITALLMLASGEVIYKLIGEKDYVKAMAFLLYFVQQEDNQYSFRNCYVGENEGEIVAAILVYDGAKLEEFRNPVLEHVHRHFDAQLHAEDETQAGEYYIDSLGVLTNQQRKGIGSKMLQFVMQELSTDGGGTIGLLVDKANPEAKKLYLNSGFELVGEKELFGISLEHLQLKVAAAEI